MIVTAAPVPSSTLPTAAAQKSIVVACWATLLRAVLRAVLDRVCAPVKVLAPRVAAVVRRNDKHRQLPAPRDRNSPQFPASVVIFTAPGRINDVAL